jgi:hypothetical protein
MEIVPLGERVLVEARVMPADIGFVKLGQPVDIKLSAYEYTVYGSLKGTVLSISPDAMGDPERAASPEGTWYRALVRADTAALQVGDRQVPGAAGHDRHGGDPHRPAHGAGLPAAAVCWASAVAAADDEVARGLPRALSADCRVRGLDMPRGFELLARLALGFSGPRQPTTRCPSAARRWCA